MSALNRTAKLMFFSFKKTFNGIPTQRPATSSTKLVTIEAFAGIPVLRK